MNEREIEMVYAGQRLYKTKKYFMWVEIESGKERFFEKSIVKAAIGNIYLITETEDSIYVKGRKAPIFKRRSHDDVIMEWAIKDEEVQNQLNIKKLNAKAAKNDPFKKLMENVEDCVTGLNVSERRALLAKLSEAIFKFGM